MIKSTIYVRVFLVIWAAVACVQAQKSTELFIPIGKSPGISGKCSVVGKIDSTSSLKQMIFMHDSTGENYNVKITNETKFFLDKSELKEKNQIGSFEDCHPGVFSEVLYHSHTRQIEGEADWVKLRVEKSDSQ